MTTLDGAPRLPSFSKPATAPTPPRVHADISRFNPKKLVAGGGDEMSLWIGRGVVDLHGGQVQPYTAFLSTLSGPCLSPILSASVGRCSPIQPFYLPFLALI